MKRILRLSAIAGALVAAFCLTSLTPVSQSTAYGYGTITIGPGGVSYYNGYGQGYYGGYGQGYGQPYRDGYGNDGYSVYGYGPYGYGTPDVYVYGNRTYSRHHYHRSPVYYGRNYGPMYSPYGYGGY